MKNQLALALTLCLLSPASGALAAPDLFVGDAALYSSAGGNTIHPNILLTIDNSAGMAQSGGGLPYDPATTYRGARTPDAIYVRTSATGGTINYGSYIGSTSSVTCASALAALAGPGAPGAYYGPLKKDGTCNAPSAGNYYSGNLLNYLTGSQWLAGTSYSVGDSILVGDATYLCTKAGTTGSTQPVWPTTVDDTVADGTAIWKLPSSASLLSQVKATLLQVLASARNRVNVGLALFGSNNHGAQIVLPILDISETSANGPANYAALRDAVQNIQLLNANAQPVNEALWDAGVYFRGQDGNSQLKISSDTSSHPSPVRYSCQPNEVILLTTGNTADTTATKKFLTDLNGNGTIGDAADAAIYNNTTDCSAALSGVQGIQTNIIQLLTAEVPILKEAAISTWNSDQSIRGAYYNIQNTSELTQALNDLLVAAVLPIDTSFVAPVVPVSPENRTYSGSRVYMGFFKPLKGRAWHGNLKKYGVSSDSYLVGQNNQQACYVDIDGNGIDDIMKTSLPSGAINGTFMSNASSFWSTGADAGLVESGGAGQVLQNDVYPNRTIYTHTGTSAQLTHASNLFTATNGAITPAMLGVAATTDAAKLIGFVHGRDAYDESSPNAQREWLFGDILHSRPVIVNYSTYQQENEGNCGSNTSIIYVGANDGMLHAIRDCDGSELWGFIPPGMLGHLSYLAGTTHSYFADATPSVYIFNKNNDGNINPANGDKVILVFGERRGGGRDTAPTTGSYYALDVTVPASPKLLWSLSNQSAGFTELAETWSEPKIVKLKIGTASKIVAFVGAGYDNIHEDTRFGNTRSFTNAASVNLGGTGEGNLASGGSTAASALTNAKGRGVYAFEIATLDAAGAPDLANSGTKIWGYTHANNTNMRFSIPSELAAIDSNNSGFTDTLYVGDTGGQVWRFDVGNTNPALWSARRLYDLGTSAAGNKFFYRPSVVIGSGVKTIFIGSGDREHPLNADTNLVNRLYSLKDLGANQPESTLTESDLSDVTDDQIQTTTSASGATSISGILATLGASHGWFIKLNYFQPGEKALASPVVFNKVAYFTTYTPTSVAVVDPCQAGNLGTSRLYAVDFLTGAAVLDYDTTNNGVVTSNLLAKPGTGEVLLRSDRVKTIGSGIASGTVIIISPGGVIKALIGVGGVIASENPKKGGTVRNLYWRKK